MALLRRVNVGWTNINGGPGLSTHWFEHTPGNAVPIATAVDTFWKANLGRVAIGVSGQVLDDQPIYDTSTGKIVSMEQGGAPAPISGTASSEPLPGFTQGLLRLKTGMFISGRRLQGHIFVPGPVELDSNGGPTTQYVSLWNTAAATLLTSTNTLGKWVVYSRVHLASANVTSALMWSKYAVLRSRR